MTAAVQAEQARAIRAEAVRAGRRPDAVKIMSSFDCVVAATHEEAVAKHEAILAAQNPDVAVASYAMFTGLDLSAYDPDTPMAELSTELSQTQVTRFAGQTVGQVLDRLGVPRRRRRAVRRQRRARWPTTSARSPTRPTSTASCSTRRCSLPSTIDFVELVLPILRERGIAPVDDRPMTLRQRLTGGEATLPADHPGAAARAFTD